MKKKYIVRRRASELEIYQERIKFVNFNAWKYSDESLRRQFLIFLDGEEREGGLGTQIGVKDELYKSKESTKSKLTLRWLYLIITAALLFVIFSLTIFIEWIKDSLMLGSVLSVLVIIAFIGACLLTVLFETFKKEIIQKEQVTETLHRLDQPDQFEDKFKEIIKKAKKKWTKIVIAIDDIDRCREDKAIEMLRMIKTFLDEDDCIYIIPCDDEKIRKHLRTAMGYEEASEDANEFLRKFFQVVLRIPLSIRDNVESYTKKCTSEAGFEEDVGGVVVAAFWEDPRRIKQFINNLTALRELAKAKEREEEGEENLIEPRLVTSHFPFLAKIEAIRAKWPEIIEKIREDRGLLQTLQNDANNEKDPSKMQDDISKAWDKGVKEFLKETRNVKGEEDWVSVFCDLGQPTYISAIPDGERFANLVLAGAEERKENVKKIKKLIEDNSNFSIEDADIEDAELENELNEGLISEGLKNNFKTKKKITLSKTAALEKGKDNNWKVTDVERTYVIKKVHKKLNIYDTELKDRYTKVIRIIFDKQRKKGNTELAFNAFNVMVEICSADIEEGGKIIGDENRASIGKWVAEILDSDDMWGMIADKLNQNQLSKKLEEYVLISAEVMRAFVSRIEKTKDIQKRALYSDVYFKLKKYDTIKSDFLNANLDIIKNVTSQPDDLIQLALDNLKRLKVLSPDKDKEVAEQLFDALTWIFTRIICVIGTIDSGQI